MLGEGMIRALGKALSVIQELAAGRLGGRLAAGDSVRDFAAILDELVEPLAGLRSRHFLPIPSGRNILEPNYITHQSHNFGSEWGV